MERSSALGLLCLLLAVRALRVWSEGTSVMGVLDSTRNARELQVLQSACMRTRM